MLPSFRLVAQPSNVSPDGSLHERFIVCHKARWKEQFEKTNAPVGELVKPLLLQSRSCGFESRPGCFPILHGMLAKRIASALRRSQEVVDPNASADQDALDDDQQRDREKRIEGLIRSALNRIGLPLLDADQTRWPVSYDDDTREATVYLDCNEGIPLSKLQQLLQSGLSSDFQISDSASHDFCLTVEFIVDPALDHAQ